MTTPATDPPVKQGLVSWFLSNAYIFLCLAPMFWAGNFVMGRYVAGHVPPFALGNMRWITATLLLLPVAWPHVKRDWPVIRTHLPIIIFLGLTGPTLFNTIGYIGLNYTTAINGLVLQSAGPVLIVITSFLCFGDSFTWRQAFGIVISLSGVLAIISEGNINLLLALSFNYGDILILIGFMSWAVYTVFLRKRPDVHWLTFAFSIAFVAVIANAPFWAIEHLSGKTLQPTWTTVLAILYAGIFPSIISYNLYNRGVQLIGSNRSGVFLHLVPFYGSILAIGLLGEKLQFFHVGGLALILTGVTLAARR